MRNKVIIEFDKLLMHFRQNDKHYHARECNGQVRFHEVRMDDYITGENQVEFLQRIYELKVKERLDDYIQNLLFIGECGGVNYYKDKRYEAPIFEQKGTFYELSYDGYESVDYLDNKLLNEAVKKIKGKANE